MTLKAHLIDPPTPLKRELNLLEVALSGTGIILGAGVYVLIGDAAALAGNAVWLSFAFAALIAVFTGLSYAELSSMFPTAGAEYDCFSCLPSKARLHHRIMVILSGVVGAAAVSMGFAGYFGSFAGVPLLPVAAVLLIGLAFLTAWGISESTNVAIVLTLVEVGGLLGIIAIGLPHVGSVNYLEMPSGLPGVFAGAALIFFAFQGFEEMVKLSEEAENPKKTIPRGLMFALVITIVLYLLVAVAAVSAVGFTSLASFPAPFAEIATTYLGSGGSALFTIIALFLRQTPSSLCLSLPPVWLMEWREVVLFQCGSLSCIEPEALHGWLSRPSLASHWSFSSSTIYRWSPRSRPSLST